MLYYGILILSSNELGPVNTIEIAFITLMLLASSMINTLVFSDIAALTIEFSKQGTLY